MDDITKPYTVGELENPSDNDDGFEELEEATEYAVRISINDSVIAVWDHTNENIVAIAYQRSLFLLQD